jgi:ribosomal protein S18 acetylase RimI-like enzyme
MQAPAALHDVFGETPSLRQLVVVLAFGIGAAAWLMFGLVDASAPLAWWRLAIAALLVTDIAAGCIANFTPSTNDFYAKRPRNRWVFIAVHVHVLALAAALGADLHVAFGVWAYTVVAAVLVNLRAGERDQGFVAGVLLAVALVWIPQCHDVAPQLSAIYALFVLKVVYAFAVDHRLVIDGDTPIRDLRSTDRSAFVAVMSAAFARDPWIEHTLGPADAPGSARRRAAFMSFMFDHTRLLGARPLGLFDGDRLVACALLEPPTSRLRHALAMVVSALRFIPVALRLGASTTKRLNDYVQRTRAVAPTTPHHYVSMIGVTPQQHGRGLGKRLMTELLRRADESASSTGVALDTENPDNVAMYERWGFAVVAEIDLGRVTATAMFRAHDRSVSR